MRTGMAGVAVLLLAAAAHAQTPAVNAGGIVNAGSYASGGVAPGSIVSIFGTNLANGLVLASTIPLPIALGNVNSVTFNGVNAPLYFVSNTQINAQVPWDVLPSGTASGTASVVVTTSAGSSASQTVSIVAALPGIFTITANGLGQAIATDNTDGALATGTVAGVLSHPIKVGSYLIIWCTGLGAGDQTVLSGSNTGGAIVNTILRPTVLIGGVQATFVYSVLSPQYVGVYQVGVQVPAGTPTGAAITLQLQVNGISTSSKVSIEVAPPPTTAVQTSCTLTSISCDAITINGDPPASGSFSGYADATIRQDPQTGTLWMAYSYLRTISLGTQGIDTHVASSTDGGKTWYYQGTLYTSQPVTDPITGGSDYTHHEVMNLLPQVVNGVTYWYGIHSVYYVPVGGGASQVGYSKRWEIAMAPGTATGGPMGLANATPEYLGQNIDLYPQQFPVTTNLSDLNSQVNGCAEFFEPALVLSNNNLYLFMSCMPASGQSGAFYAVFSTPDPQDHPGNWTWSYVPEGGNRFASLNDATNAGTFLGAAGATYITQMDVAPGKNPGQLISVFTVAYNDAAGKHSYGCVAAELAGIAPPAFVYNDSGQLQVDGYIKSTDSQPGPGSCTYSPYSATGMIMAHLQQKGAPQNGSFYTFLMQSGIAP
ncbi:MAG TPA: hypothetical protein VMI94_04955 [Bryobacteraceae bacterium]|nr:hypothetical protein [Bryobacteraceae bacterium]